LLFSFVSRKNPVPNPRVRRKSSARFVAPFGPRAGDRARKQGDNLTNRWQSGRAFMTPRFLQSWTGRASHCCRKMVSFDF
jgi:hypothetical protein